MWKGMIAGFIFTLLLLVGAGYLGYQSLTTERTSEDLAKKIENDFSKELNIETQTAKSDTLSNQTEAAEQQTETDETEAVPAAAQSEAIEVVMSKFSLEELLAIYEEVQKGATNKEELLELLNERLTDEEIEALKSFGITELENMIQ
ncbi:hypothetical protein [Bacillus suaedae]|uniref:Uncharacterized protein n=1 Tax=Halalkalibacter suaedae TaxID=2822140 RepID=A0A941AQT9_9BACI|nr:hypothetical protein [Bacillus suaedae]MBP3953171.1 hypothetical protein [Bacillus suaedae]